MVDRGIGGYAGFVTRCNKVRKRIPFALRAGTRQSRGAALTRRVAATLTLTTLGAFLLGVWGLLGKCGWDI